MHAFVTVVGKDKVGIIAAICNLLAEKNVNILDISQTILQDCFTMFMLVDASACSVDFAELSESLSELALKMDLTIRIQREEIFNAMHKI